MIGIIIVVFVLIIIFGAFYFESYQEKVEIEIEIEKRIRDGTYTKLSNGKIVKTINISKDEIRITIEYGYLLNYYSISYLDSLSYKELKTKYIQKKKEIRAQNIAKRKKEEKRNLEKKIKLEKENQEKLKYKRKTKWEELYHYHSYEKVSGEEPGVYLIICYETYKTYIGSSQNMLRRINQHLSSLRRNKHYSYLMQNDFNSYGEYSFSFYVLTKLTSNSTEDHKTLRNSLEYFEQKDIDTFKPEYNYYHNVKEGKKHFY